LITDVEGATYSFSTQTGFPASTELSLKEPIRIAVITPFTNNIVYNKELFINGNTINTLFAITSGLKGLDTQKPYTASAFIVDASNNEIVSLVTLDKVQGNINENSGILARFSAQNLKDVLLRKTNGFLIRFEIQQGEKKYVAETKFAIAHSFFTSDDDFVINSIKADKHIFTLLSGYTVEYGSMPMPNDSKGFGGTIRYINVDFTHVINKVYKYQIDAYGRTTDKIPNRLNQKLSAYFDTYSAIVVQRYAFSAYDAKGNLLFSL
jgi:hypothetical protein